MKRTISVNLGGVVFNIDDDAYEKLKNYLDTIESYFDESSGREEIMADIESRIAELLREKHKGADHVVSINDIDEIITLMGRPEDFAEGESESGKDFEPPFADRQKKRLYRDGENSVIGGVCSGIGHYFGIDPVWIRVIWVAAFIIYGFGLLIYLILWIIVPKARTTAEKLEMRGKPVNFNTIGRSVEVEADNLKSKFDTFSKSESAARFQKKANTALQRIGNGIYDAFKFIFKFLGKALGILFIIGGITGMFAVIAGILGSSMGFIMIGNDHDFISYSYTELSDILFESQLQFVSALVGTLLIVTSPLAAVTFSGYALLRYPERVSGAPGWFVFGMFVIGLLSSLYAGISTAGQFAKKAVITQKAELSALADTFNLTVSDRNYSTRFDDVSNQLRRASIIYLDENTLYLDQVSFDIQSSRDTVPRISVTKKSRGSSFEEAEAGAQNIEFNYSTDRGELQLSDFIKIPRSDKWRVQEADVLITLPTGTVIAVDEQTKKHFPEIARSKSNIFEMQRGGFKAVKHNP